MNEREKKNNKKQYFWFNIEFKPLTFHPDRPLPDGLNRRSTHGRSFQEEPTLLLMNNPN